MDLPPHDLGLHPKCGGPLCLSNWHLYPSLGGPRSGSGHGLLPVVLGRHKGGRLVGVTGRSHSGQHSLRGKETCGRERQKKCGDLCTSGSDSLLAGVRIDIPWRRRRTKAPACSGTGLQRSFALCLPDGGRDLHSHVASENIGGLDHGGSGTGDLLVCTRDRLSALSGERPGLSTQSHGLLSPLFPDRDGSQATTRSST